MKWAHRQAAMMELDLLLFTVGGVRLAAPLDPVAGVLSDVSMHPGNAGDLASIPFQGREVPLLRAENLFNVGAHTGGAPGAVILFHQGPALYGVAVDSVEDVLQLTPGDRLYRFPPEEPEWSTTRRPWGFVELGDVPILLVDFGPIRVH